MNKDAAVLFEFMKNILYSTECQNINTDSLSEDYRIIGEGLNVICDYVNEQREYGSALIHGNFDYVNKHKDNQLCWGMKSLQTEIRTFIYQLSSALEGKAVVNDYANPMHTKYCRSVKALVDAKVENEKIIAEKDAEIARLKAELERLKK